MELSTRDSGGGRDIIDDFALVCQRLELSG
jgi:hypothetical protein